MCAHFSDDLDIHLLVPLKSPIIKSNNSIGSSPTLLFHGGNLECNVIQINFYWKSSMKDTVHVIPTASIFTDDMFHSTCYALPLFEVSDDKQVLKRKFASITCSHSNILSYWWVFN